MRRRQPKLSTLLLAGHLAGQSSRETLSPSKPCKCSITTGFEQGLPAGAEAVHKIVFLILNMFICKINFIGQLRILMDSGEYQNGNFWIRQG